MKHTKLFTEHGAELARFPDPARDIAPAPETARSAILAGGCFWCTEAVFLPLDGVTGVTSGYIGGSPGTANYQAVCSGTTGHAEAIKVDFDPAVISYGQLLKVFFAVAHDPTQLNRQGADRGTQYRSAVFPLDDQQRLVAEEYIAQLEAAQAFPDRIVTTVEAAGEFFPAEAYHQNFVARNPAQPYVAAVALPKVAKLQAAFPEKLRDRDRDSG
jgi:peptide-methionine (S)-S-oxide reductase